MDNEEDKPESVLEPHANKIKPAQIPLLDDVVFNTTLPRPKLSKPNQPTKPIPADTAQNVPRPTDLFGGSPETAQSGPFSPEYTAVDLDEAALKMRQDTEKVVDNLVAEYSEEIVARLKDELTSLLNDLNQTEQKPKAPDAS